MIMLWNFVLVIICAGVVSTSCSRRTVVAQVPVPAASVTIEQPAQPVLSELAGESENEPEEALKFFVSQRAPDGVNLPLERLAAAREHAERMKTFFIAHGKHSLGNPSSSNAAASSTPGAWTSVGPANVGGLTRALVINPRNPDVMYAGASGGGVWKSIDAGKSWAALTDSLITDSVQSLAIDPQDPNTLYAGTGDNIGGATGIRGRGIYKTSDGGQSWVLLPGTVGDANFFYVFALVVSVKDSNRVYAGTATGVWTSADGGNSWAQTLVRVAPNTGCEELLLRTDQPTDYLFASCGRLNAVKTAVFRNIDASGGGSWDTVLQVNGMGRTALAIAPSQQNTIYALVADVTPGSDFSQGILALYRSDSNGDADSWVVKASQNDSNRVNQTLLSNPRSAFVGICSTGKPTFSGQGSHDNVLAVDPLNPEHLWAGGIDIFRSDDGGVNWGIAMFWETAAPTGAHADNHRLVFHPNYNGTTNQSLFNASDGGIYMTANANADVATGARAGCSPYSTLVAWKNLNTGYSVTQFYDGAVYPGANQYIAGAQDNGTLWGSDGTSKSWLSFRGGDGGFVLVNPRDPNEVYSNYVYLSLARSTDGGNTLTSITAGITEPSTNFLFIAPVAMDLILPQRLYIGGRSLWRTDDRGDNWTQATTIGPSTQGLISAIAVSPLDSNLVMYGTSGGQVFHSNNALGTDSAATWDFARPRSSGFVARITFDPSDVDTAYAVYRTYKSTGQNYVYKTTDQGVTWTPIDGTGDGALPDAPVHSLVVDPLNNQTLYAGTELGVFTSLDGGGSWLRDDNGFANTPITKLVLDRSAGVTNLIAFTYGRGVWKTAVPGTGTPCAYQVSPAALLDATGSDIQLKVDTGAGCAWSVTPVSGYLYAKSPAVGTGAGSAYVYADWNVSTVARTGLMAVGDKSVVFTQKGASFLTNNDEIAAVIPGLPYLGYVDSRRDTIGLNDPVHSCTNSQDFKSVWWSFVAPDTGTVEIAAQGRRYDVLGNSGVVLAIYDTERTVARELSCSTSPRNTTARLSATARVPVIKGNIYQVEVSATGDTANDGGLTILSVVMK